MSEPRPGDWVHVKALVVDADPHPDEYSVRLESHNEHYVGLVRRDHCELATPPWDTPRCPSLNKDPRDNGLIRQCDLKYEHAGDHEARDPSWDLPSTWKSKDEYGSVEL